MRRRRRYWSPTFTENSKRKRRISSNAARHERRKRKEAGAEKFDPLEIYERDSWICQLCKEPVDRTLRWPAALSASLDHKVPLAAGGAHTRNNTQIARLICNIRKGARTTGAVSEVEPQ